MDTQKLGSFLKKLRKENGLTQEQLAEKLGVSNRTVSRWETGINIPDLDIIIDLSQLYRVDIKELLAGERTTEKSEDTCLVRCVAEYSATKQTHTIRRVFAVAVIGVVAVGSLVCTTQRFFHDVIGGGFVLVALLAAFLLYNIITQAFRVCRTAVGYLFSLIGGFSAAIVSDIVIVCLFFGGGSYHNYGLVGYLYILAIILGAFLIALLLVLILSKHKLPKD